MGNESSRPPKKNSRASIDGPKQIDRRTRSSSGTPQFFISKGDSDKIATSATSSPRLERRPSCRNRLGEDGMGQTPSRRGSRRGSNVGMDSRNTSGSVAEAAKLTPYQCSVLQQSWPRIKANNVVFTQAFKVLMHKSPTARDILQKTSIVEGFKGKSTCDINAHIRYLNDLFDHFFADMQQPASEAESRCQEIGMNHLGMSEKCVGSVWEQLGEILAELITRSDSVRQKREAVKAWISFISYLVDMMKSGYVNEFRRRHARLSIGHAEMAFPQGTNNTTTLTAGD